MRKKKIGQVRRNLECGGRGKAGCAWVGVEPVCSEVSQKEKHQYSILMHIHGIYKDGNNNPVYETAKETLMYSTVFWTLWERKSLG